MLSPTLFLLFFVVTLLTVPGGSASLAKEVFIFHFPFLFYNHLFGSICLQAFIKSGSYLAVPPLIPRHHPFQSPILSIWGISQTDFPRLFSHFSAYFSQTPIPTTFLCIPSAPTWFQVLMPMFSLAEVIMCGCVAV